MGGEGEEKREGINGRGWWRAKKRGREGSNGGVVEGEHWNKQGARKGGERKGERKKKGEEGKERW